MLQFFFFYFSWTVRALVTPKEVGKEKKCVCVCVASLIENLAFPHSKRLCGSFAGVRFPALGSQFAAKAEDGLLKTVLY